MSEYDFACDICHLAVTPVEGVVAWTTTGRRESDHVLVHAACAPVAASDRIELSLLLQPVTFFGFVIDRFGREIEDRAPLAAIVWALVPFISRPDNGAEILAMRARGIGHVVGVKPDFTVIHRPRLPGSPTAVGD